MKCACLVALVFNFLLNSSLLFAVDRPIELAITIDDLPSTGADAEGVSRLQVIENFIRAFKKHHVEGVVGFVNGRTLVDSPDKNELIKRWIGAGHKLGNHTYAHSNLSEVSLDQFFEDVEKNGPILMSFGKKNSLPYFRFPYLSEGNTTEKRDGFRAWLNKKKLVPAQVTVDFHDWRWNSPFGRCAKRNEQKTIAWLKESYLSEAKKALENAKSLAHEFFPKYGIKHVLLLHVGVFDSVMVGDLIEQYSKMGTEIISLTSAVGDPSFQINTKRVNVNGVPFLAQINEMHGNAPKVFDQETLRVFEKLDKICL